jgi:hypothetical protein
MVAPAGAKKVMRQCAAMCVEAEKAVEMNSLELLTRTATLLSAAGLTAQAMQ